MLNNKKGAILVIFGLVVAVVLLIYSFGVVSHAILERHAFEITKKRADAFYMAEAAMDKALAELRSNPFHSGPSGVISVSRGSHMIGQYEYTVEAVGSGLRKITGSGYVPQKIALPDELTQTCQVEGVAYVPIIPPSSFFGNAVYSADDVEFRGGSYTVTGNVDCATEVTNTGHSSGTINGTVTQNDPAITQAAFYSFNFQALQALAQSQTYSYNGATVNNDFTAADLASKRPLPTNFWYQAPTDPSDPKTGVPNIVYIEGPLTVKASSLAIGGFILVVGNLANPGVVESDESATIDGNLTVNGCIYSTGGFTLNGHGNSVIDGGIWAGDGAVLRGNTKITYNQDYMFAIEYYVKNHTPPTLKLLSWRQLKLYN